MEMERPLDEQVAAALGEDLPHHLSYSSESTSASPVDNEELASFDYTHFIDDVAVLPPLFNPDPLPLPPPLMATPPPQLVDQPDVGTTIKIKSKEEQKAGETGSNRKRKREPSRVMDHILAERRRRELLSQLFISLSAIVPGLKKTDKTSVLGEAIKYLKQLQDKVKVLEDVAAKRTVESVVVVRKSSLVVDDETIADDGSSGTVDDSPPSTGGGGGGGGGGEHLPEIEVKESDKTILFHVYCENHKGILGRLFDEIDKHHGLRVVSCNLIPFGTLACDITIIIQKEKEFDKNLKELLRSLRSAILFT